MTAAVAWVLAGALWLGCLVGGPWWAALAAVGVLALAARLRSDRWRLAMALVALGLLGAGLAGGRVALAEAGSLPAWAERGGLAVVEAVAVTEARDTAGGAWQVVRVVRLDGRAVRERAALMLARLEEAPDLGERVRLDATARPLGRDGFDGHLRRLHAAVALDPRSPARQVRPPGRLWAATTVVRERVRAAAHGRLDHDRATVLTGLVTGDVRGQDPGQREAFRAAGLTHLVVVSGRHVGLVLAAVVGAAVLAGLGARGRRRVALVALAWFALVTRWQPSVLRASAMAALVLAAGLGGRRADARHALAMAAVLLLLADPMLAGHLGFALSMSATAGVLLGAPWLAERLPGPRPLRLLVAACVAAQAGAAPVLLGLDGGVPLGSLPANLVAVPAAALAQSVGLAAALVAQASVEAGGAIAALAGPALGVVLWSAGAFSSGPAVTGEALRSPAVVLVVVAVAVLWWGVRRGVGRRRGGWPAPRGPGRPAGVGRFGRLVALAVPVAVVAGALVWPVPLGRPEAVESLTVTLLDVGQGDAVLVEVPGGEPGGGAPARLLVDGGPEPADAWRHLRRRGVRRLDAVALSHPHDDHSGGLPEVLRRADVGALLVGPDPLEADVAPSARETYAVARGAGVPIVALQAGQRFSLGHAEVEVLSPPPDGSLGEDLNENSLVLRVVAGSGTVLLTGDAEVLAQSWLLRRPDLLAADILKVPHHGGATNTAGFVEAVGADVALVGVGAGNDYGHPTASALDALAAAGARVYRTDLHGTVRARVRGGAVEVETEREADRRDRESAADAYSVALWDRPPAADSACSSRASMRSTERAMRARSVVTVSTIRTTAMSRMSPMSSKVPPGR